MVNSSAIKDFIEYWDNWHREWYTNSLTTPPNLAPIKEWITPIDKGGNESPMWQYFPEPYWGNPYAEELVSVFLNLNPGGGGDCQDVLSINKPSSILYNTYGTNKFYSKTIEQLSRNLCYTTTNWFDRKRSNWINKLMNGNNNSENKYSVANILCADLIPWHTHTVNSTINKYIENNKKCILYYVIKPITSISQQATLKGLVFARGKNTKKMLASLNIKQTKQYKNGKFEINLFNYNNAVILVFVGGQGMYLPNPDDKKYSSDSNVKLSISDIVISLKM
jgi:hypothetical protein